MSALLPKSPEKTAAEGVRLPTPSAAVRHTI